MRCRAFGANSVPARAKTMKSQSAASALRKPMISLASMANVSRAPPIAQAVHCGSVCCSRLSSVRCR